MSNTGCVRVGHKLSYDTGNDTGPAKSGKWCLIKYSDDDCDCIDDYEVVQ